MVKTGIYKKAVEIAATIGVTAALGVMRGIASYDWYANYVTSERL